MNPARRHLASRDHARILLLDQWQHTDALLRRLPRAMREEDVHAARVALRRLRTVLSAIAPALDSLLLARARRDLKKFADALGEVRDADIRCRILLPALHPQGATGALIGVLRAERLQARRRLRSWLRSASAGRRLERLSTTLEDQSLFTRGADADVLLIEGMRRHCRKVRQFLRKGRRSASERHAMRIRVKKCRYLLDACGTGLRHESDQKTSALLHDLQDCLGDLNDLEQTLRWVADQDLPSPAARSLRDELRAGEERSRSRLRHLRRKLRACAPWAATRSSHCSRTDRR